MKGRNQKPLTLVTTLAHCRDRPAAWKLEISQAREAFTVGMDAEMCAVSFSHQSALSDLTLGCGHPSDVHALLETAGQREFLVLFHRNIKISRIALRSRVHSCCLRSSNRSPS